MKKRGMHLGNLIAMVLLPYLITILVNGPEFVIMNRKTDPEVILPFIVETQISSCYEAETLKAQAVIARSNLYRKLENRDDLEKLCKNLKKMLPDIWDAADIFFNKENKKYEKAVKDTTGQVLMSDGELKLIPYHEISAGQTRDGAAAFHDTEYAYLKSVDSSADKKAPGYLGSVYIVREQLPEEFQIMEKDEKGYVISLRADDNILEAEVFTGGMGIASSNFSIQKIGDKIRFLSKGKGHGIGFSQYGGNELAKEGMSWEEILNTYFPLMEISTEEF